MTTTPPPRPCPGYRLLDVGEPTRDGDLVWSDVCGAWLPTVPPPHAAATERAHYARLDTATGRLLDRLLGRVAPGLVVFHIERPGEPVGEGHLRLSERVPPDLFGVSGTLGEGGNAGGPDETAAVFDSLAYWLRVPVSAEDEPPGTRFRVEPVRAA